MVEKTEQIVREAPEVEAYKLGLLESAKKLADQGDCLPKQQVAYVRSATKSFSTSSSRYR